MSIAYSRLNVNSFYSAPAASALGDLVGGLGLLARSAAGAGRVLGDHLGRAGGVRSAAGAVGDFGRGLAGRVSVENSAKTKKTYLRLPIDVNGNPCYTTITGG